MITMQLQNSTLTTDAPHIQLLPIYMSALYDISLSKQNIIYIVTFILISLTITYILNINNNNMYNSQKLPTIKNHLI